MTDQEIVEIILLMESKPYGYIAQIVPESVVMNNDIFFCCNLSSNNNNRSAIETILGRKIFEHQAYKSLATYSKRLIVGNMIKAPF